MREEEGSRAAVLQGGRQSFGAVLYTRTERTGQMEKKGSDKIN